MFCNIAVSILSMAVVPNEFSIMCRVSTVRRTTEYCTAECETRRQWQHTLPKLSNPEIIISCREIDPI
eukprot:461406-Prymnesium_polylepis.1